MKIAIISVISIAIAAILIGGVIMLASGGKNSNSVSSQGGNNVSVVDGTQIITIKAKGGYSPKVTTAKADTPTVIKVYTQGTFDCSSALTIPNIGYSKNLSPSGETEIEIPPQNSGTVMRGVCSMGMYSFKVRFE